MTTSPPQVNGQKRPMPPLGDALLTAAPHVATEPPRPTRREEARADRRLDREEDRKDRDQQRKLKDEAKQARIARRQAIRIEKEKARTRRRKDRKAAWQNTQVKLSHHMPLWGLPVAIVSLVMGWSGQAGAAAHLGMGLFAVGVPVLTEGMVLTFAGLTGQAIEQGRPYKGLMRITWSATLVAAAINGAGHLIEDRTADGMYRAGAYALASLAAMILWWVVMRSKRAAISGRTAEEIARWKRLGRRHPILVRRARRVADNTGANLPSAYATVWERANGAAPGEPSIREIRASRRALYRRSQAESWDGKRSLWNGPAVPAAAVSVGAVKARGTAGEAAGPVPAERVDAPVLPVSLLVPGADGGWVKHPVPVLPMAAAQGVRTRRDGTATTRFPQGKDADSKRVRAHVTDDRLDRVRKLVTDAAAKHLDLRKHPSNRAVARSLGCRPATARELLATALADRGITRK
ncbi:hypothetical protein ACIRD6_35620 [Streptomyces sp. NPDC102473]|uniref:hypothetical protein n=1 Tax=Streptomyces sp. NPDC102473 TaxID=3366180 RepID=UPI0038275421